MGRLLKIQCEISVDVATASVARRARRMRLLQPEDRCDCSCQLNPLVTMYTNQLVFLTIKAHGISQRDTGVVPESSSTLNGVTEFEAIISEAAMGQQFLPDFDRR